jgi:rubrerythrin
MRQELKQDKVGELLLQALETEIGGVLVYRAALRCARNEELRGEWEKYLRETEQHQEILVRICNEVGLDPATETPGRRIVRQIGQSLVHAMDQARAAGVPELAEIVATECVVHAETKDHLNWELLGEVAGALTGDERKALEEAFEEVEEQEDEHLYHTMGWSRELWLDSLGLPAVLPPPEEEQDVKTAIGAERARQSRREMRPGQ